MGSSQTPQFDENYCEVGWKKVFSLVLVGKDVHREQKEVKVYYRRRSRPRMIHPMRTGKVTI
jgi:hypothetical protein